MKRKIVILGSTGSIGKSLISVLKKDANSFEIVLLTANKNIKDLLKQITFFKVKNIIVTDYKKYLIIKKYFKNKKINIYNNFKSLEKILKNHKIDYTMSAISGLVGLKPTIKVIRYSKKIAIANKEAIICGWSLIKNELKKYKTDFIPVDSEHFSIWSLINNAKDQNIEKLFITASGGPFINYPLKNFQFITTKQALKHPNWSMGKKISIDSATMMNKVFEIIEAKKIFDLSYEKLKILVHPKSYVHAVVKFDNGLTKLLIHDTNMVIPIFNSLYPNHSKKINSKKLDFNIINNLNFKVIDIKRFPVVKMLKSLPSKDSLYETVIVTINDKLVNKFLRNEISFIEISKILLKVINFKEFKKYKLIKPRNVAQIEQLQDYVSLKIDSLSV
ncbi:1-deoxy-D-xylulose-5-phosphate reductoisomerase [Candidatus Pelagibacter ubique]|nr:1-deoxy-D-xylulose-5-phosphate reductoisomerase [Candidatus Pelagibacter ubique]